jgi:hypothetical protein
MSGGSRHGATAERVGAVGDYGKHHRVDRKNRKRNRVRMLRGVGVRLSGEPLQEKPPEYRQGNDAETTVRFVSHYLE